jgi:hypothetical protein
MLLLATPNSGASLAAIGLQLFPGNQHFELMSPFSQATENLSREWGELGISKKVPVRYAVGGADLIVSAPSAKGAAKRPEVDMLIGFNHTSIAAGRKATDSNYLLVKDFILDKRQLKTNERAKTEEGSGDPLFEIYSLASERFYLVRSYDEGIHNANAGGHVWISGPSGLGKTAALKRRAALSGWQLTHCLLSSLDAPTASRILWSICAQIAEAQGEPVPPIDSSPSELINRFRQLLRNTAGRSTAYLIEEIPLPPGAEYQVLMKHVLELMLAIEAEQANAVRLMFSSINCPSENIPRGMAKLRSRMQLIPFELWTTDEVAALVELLCDATGRTLALQEKTFIVEAAKGSPRFVKGVFRRWRNGTANGITLKELLAAVEAEQV